MNTPISRRVLRSAIRVVVYTAALFVAQLAFSERFDHTEAYTQNFMFTIMVLFESSLIWWDVKKHA